ncbi:MAG: hypothetical protein LBM75_00630 [Myxococcales bacterium]|jgi:hypothetical protein|nr:hypothetical protein [Myxococcales bacterium]
MSLAFLLLTSTLLTASTEPADPANPAAPWLLTIEQARDAPSAALVAVRPGGERRDLLHLDVLPNYTPHARLSSDRRTLFLARQTQPNRIERGAELLAFDVTTRALRTIAQGVDAVPPLALSDEAVAWFETIATRPAMLPGSDEADFDRVTVSLRAALAGQAQAVELLRLDDILGVHFAGIADSGIVLYVITPEEAAFYLLPIEERFARASRAPIRQPRRAQPTQPKLAIEARDEAIPPSGLMRLAAAPTGPVAREFVVHGQQLFFGALTRDRMGSALFWLDIPPLDDLVARRDADASRAARELTRTGERSPAPLIVRDRLVFARSNERGEAVQSRALDLDKGATKTLLQTVGQLRLLAADESASSIAVRRDFEEASELLWIDLETSTARRLQPLEFYEVIGFSKTGGIR